MMKKLITLMLFIFSVNIFAADSELELACQQTGMIRKEFDYRTCKRSKADPQVIRACSKAGFNNLYSLNECFRSKASVETVNACGKLKFVEMKGLVGCVESKADSSTISSCANAGYRTQKDFLSCLEN